MALMQIFQGPANAILDSPTLYKAILILMYACHNYLLEPICSHLRQKLKTHPSQGNWSIITNPFRVQFFWDQSDIRAIDIFQICSTRMKSLSQLIEIMTDNVLALLKEQTIKTIRTRGFVNGHMLDYVIHFPL